MKLIDLSQARQAAEALHQDPILKGAVLMVLNSLPVVEMPVCKFRTCRLQGGKADPDRCAGCRWRKEETDGETLAE